MVDLEVICCMCGDVGFPDKIFRCNKCLNRFQHSYCSSYYGEYKEAIQVCDWCQSEERNVKHATSSSSSPSKKSRNQGSSSSGVMTKRSEFYSGEKVKNMNRQERAVAVEKVKSPGGTPSPRTSTRRYKLLKDVMC